MYFCFVKILFILFLSLQLFVVHGQRNHDVWVEGRAKFGFLAAHRSIMGHLPREHAYAAEISYMIQPRSEKLWHQAYRDPVYGLTGYFGNVGNSEILGKYFGLYVFTNFPFVKRARYTLSGKVACGLGYGTKHYNSQTNILNVAIGTPINAMIVLALENRFIFGNHSINASIDMTHFSNGAYKVPNLGLNLPHLSLGYGHRVYESNFKSDTILEHSKSWQFGAIGMASVKEVFPTEGKKYPVFGLSLIGRRYFRPKTGMEVSFDIISKQAVKAYHSDVEKTQAEIIQLGVFAGYLLPLDKFHMIIGMGYYVRDKYQPEDMFYHRTGMRYVFKNGLNINLVLKSHWARADYVEYGIGYTFKR